MSDQPQQPSMPYENEPRGPVEELIAGASAEVRAEIFNDEVAAAEAWQQGVEPEGIEATQIAAIVVATLIAVAVLVGTGIWVTVGGLSGAVEVAEDVDEYPELRDARVTAIDKIGPEAWALVSAEDNVYRIPVAEAMTAIAQQYVQRQQGIAGLVQAPDFWNTQDLMEPFAGPQAVSAAPVAPPVPVAAPEGPQAVTPLGPDELTVPDAAP